MTTRARHNPVALALVGLACTIAVSVVGCTRNYDTDAAMNETSPDGNGSTTIDDIPIEERGLPFVEQIGNAHAMFLGPDDDGAILDLGADRWFVSSQAHSMVWDSRENRVVEHMFGSSLPDSARVVWSPGDGTAALVQNGSSFFWVSAVARRAEVLPLVGSITVEVFDDVVLASVSGPNGFQLVELSSDRGFLVTHEVAELPPSRANSVQRFGNVYVYRDDQWRLRLRVAGEPEADAVDLGEAFRMVTFAGEGYLYVESDEITLFDTSDGASVEFPQTWRISEAGADDQSWVALRRGQQVAFWKPGIEPVQPEEPASDIFLGYFWTMIQPDFGVVYVDTTRGDELRLYDFETGDWYVIDGAEEAPYRRFPTVSRRADGSPVVIWPGRFGDSLEGAHSWTPEDDGFKPLSGYRFSLSRIERTNDPNRFVALSVDDRIVLADVARATLTELGLPLNCRNLGVSFDGRRALTYVDQTVSIFDAETRTSQVIGRRPVFFGARCEESFNQALTRGLFLDAFDGEIGDLVYWDGETVTPVLEGIPQSGARLDPVRGLWTIAAPTNSSVFLAVFESQGQVLTRVGRASADQLQKAWAYRDLQFTFIDTTSDSPLRATIYNQQLEVDPEPVAVASGAFTRVRLVGDDIFAVWSGENFQANVLLTLDGPIDAGPLSDWLWTPELFEGEDGDDGDEPRR
jgi:hypothetical protein